MPRHRSADYKRDIGLILTAFTTDSDTQRTKLLDSLREASFVRSVSALSGAKGFSRPRDLYFATERLKTLFAGVPGVEFVDDKCPCLRGEHVRDLLEACGATRYIRPVADESLSWVERRKLRVQAGHEATSGQKDRFVDWTLEGLDSLLKTLPRLAKRERRQRANLLWDGLALLEERRGKGVFAGEYSWTHYGLHRAPAFDAAFVRVLNEAAWIPDATGELQPPALVLFETLGWKPNPFLQSKIRFKPPVLETLAKEAGFEPGLLDLLKKLGLTREADLRSRLGEEEEREDEEDTAETDTDDDNGDDAGDVDDAIKGILGDIPGPSPPIPDQTGPESTQGSGRKSSGAGGGSDTNGSGGGSGKGGKSSGSGSGGKGSSDNKRSISSTGSKPFISYVGTHPDEEEPDPDGLEHAARMALEEQAINRIIASEPQLKRTPTHNPGYDLFEANGRGDPIRRVEVKAMTGDLRDRPVGLSHTQFKCAQEHGDAYWLYIVEHADVQQASRIVRIQDPAGRARTFCFDHGWVSVADVEGLGSDEEAAMGAQEE